jgi:CRP/FNR family cyclic AMP-dependent transcriptional regulator
VVTKEPSELYVVRREEFRRLLEESPSLAFNLMEGLARRFRAAIGNIESLALLDVYGRVARLLLDYAKPSDGESVIDECLTHREIANMVGSSREMVSRIMKDLTTGGYITVRDKRIIIKTRLPSAW